MPKKMNIIYHFRVRGTGAEGVHIAGIVNGFRSLGHRVRLVSPTNADPTVESMPAKCHKNNKSTKSVLLHKLADRLPQPVFEFMEMCYGLLAIIKLLRSVHAEKTDFIYERYAFFNIAGAFVSTMKKIPLVVEVNELSGHKRIRGQFFVKICAALERYILRRARLVVVVSDFLNQEVVKIVGGQRTKVVTIPNGVPERWLTQDISEEVVSDLRGKYGLEGKKVICFVGGLVHWHNFDFLLEAVADVRQRVNDEVVMMFVGSGPLEKHICEKAAILEIPEENLLLVGNVKHSSIPAYLKLSDVAVIPETNDFRSPIKLFEYMATGVPVIAPRKPAIEVAVIHEQNGCLFAPGDVEQLSDGIVLLLSDGVLAQGVGISARETIAENFTWEKHAKFIEGVIVGML